jgi:hypothetical protein
VVGDSPTAVVHSSYRDIASRPKYYTSKEDILLIVEPVLMAPLTLAKSSDADGVATAIGLQVDQKVDVEQMTSMLELKISNSTRFAPVG